MDVPPGRYQIRVAAVGADGTGGSVFTEVVVPKFTDDLALGGLSLGSPALPTAKRAEPLARVLPLVPLATREFSGTSQIVAQLPVRAAARAQAPITIDARLSARMATTVPCRRQRRRRGIHRAGRRRLPGAAAADAGAGVYRLVIDASLGRDRATREIAFRIAPRP